MNERKPVSTRQDRAGRERVTWCMTDNGFATEGCDNHDTYDLVIDYNAEPKPKPLYRLDPVGTTYLTPDGFTVRIRKYDDDPFIEPPITDRIRPMYDAWTPGGGATSLSDDQVLGDLWDGPNLRPGVCRVVPVVDPEGRPAPGSLFMRPNGEAWRLRDYAPDWNREDQIGARVVPMWHVQLPSGASTNGDALPDDAWLVWVP